VNVEMTCAVAKCQMAELARDKEHRSPACLAVTAAATQGRSWWERASAWTGDKMIAAGCRLARPALVAAARPRT
jgi:hypothetical protein